jgi:hypothetical protein
LLDSAAQIGCFLEREPGIEAGGHPHLGQVARGFGKVRLWRAAKANVG